MAEGVDSTLFRQVLGHFATGVTVVTALAERPVGLSVGAFFSISLEPPLVGFCVTRTSTTWPLIQAADSYCVNILAEDQEAVSRRFSATDVDRFDGLEWQPTPSGAPRLTDALAWLDCTIEAVHVAGDHDICVGLVRQLAVSGDGGPLVYFRSGYGRFAP